MECMSIEGKGGLSQPGVFENVTPEVIKLPEVNNWK